MKSKQTSKAITAHSITLKWGRTVKPKGEILTVLMIGLAVLAAGTLVVSAVTVVKDSKQCEEN